MDPRDQLQSLKRGLQVLTLINIENWVTIADIASKFALPRTTAQRILTTLQEEGYIFRDRLTKKYALTPLVRRLSEGFNDEDWVIDIANPLIHKLTKEISWPLIVAVPYGDVMLVRAATDHDAPLAIERFSVGATAPMMLAPTGHIFLAYCDDATRARLLSLLAKSDDPRQQLARSPEVVEQMVRRIRKQGYTIVQFPQPEYASNSVAVPILVNGRIFGSILMRYIKRALTEKEIREKYVPRLVSTADEIARQLAKLKQRNPMAFRIKESMEDVAAGPTK